MNSRQAKEILFFYRPGTADCDDPQFAPALELVGRDPELAAWFEQHCALHQALCSKFKQISVPEGLKEQILSERKVRTVRHAQRKATLLAVGAAALFLLIGIGAWHLQPPADNSFGSFQSRMARKVLREYPTMDLATDDLGQIRQYLARNGPHGDYVLPKPLEKTAGSGCAIFPWHGRSVAMVCFNSRKDATPKGPDLFLFIVDRSAVAQAPTANSPQFAQIKSLATASWSSGDKTYLLAGLGNEKFLKQYLGTAGN